MFESLLLKCVLSRDTSSKSPLGTFFDQNRRSKNEPAGAFSLSDAITRNLATGSERIAISRRFFSCFPGHSKQSLAKILEVARPTVSEWAIEGTVPWSKLKYLSDSQAISWDWLLDGREPKESRKEAVMPDSPSPVFDRPGINQRFLSLYPGLKTTEIAGTLGVTQGAVSGWRRNFSQVSWARLRRAVNTFNVRWDWLLDGLDPKYRE